MEGSNDREIVVCQRHTMQRCWKHCKILSYSEEIISFHVKMKLVAREELILIINYYYYSLLYKNLKFYNL